MRSLALKRWWTTCLPKRILPRLLAGGGSTTFSAFRGLPRSGAEAVALGGGAGGDTVRREQA